MRERLSRGLLARLERHTPAPLRRLQLQILLEVTARGFGVPGKRIWTLPRGRALEEYARLTRQWAAGPDADLRRLGRQAFALGRRLRRLTGLREHRDLRRLVIWLYRGIGITMEGSLPGEVTVPACYFSRFYTPEQCRVMSAVDAGVIAGLFGGGDLVFTARLTEGCGRCAAVFTEGGPEDG